MTAPLELTGFMGIATSVDPKLLPPSIGVLSLNQRPGRGDLRPWLVPLQETTVPTGSQRLSLYRMNGGYWFSWTTVVNAVKGFDGQDTTERFYFTGSGTPKWSNNVIGLGGGPPYPQASRELSVPAPTTTMTTSQTVAGTGTVADWYYVQTFVNDLGWESAPGPVSTLISAAPGAHIAIGNLDTAPAGAYGITRTRIYKSVTSTSGTASFFFLSDLAIGTTSTTDNALTVGTDVLATGANGVGGSWQPPPAAGFGLTAMWNGMLAICYGKSVYVSEPYEPYAYPLRYRIDVADNVVGLAVYGQNMLVLTDGDVYLVTGSDPASLDTVPLKIMQPCLSARSIVAFEDGALWATQSGLWHYGSRGSFSLTIGILDAAAWQALVPTTMLVSRHANLRLAFVFYNDGTQKGFCIDIDSPGSLYGLSTGYDAVHRAASGQMYVLAVGSVQQWDAGASLMTADFKSKPFQTPAPVCMSAVEVVASAYPVHLKVWGSKTAGTALLFDRNVTSDDTVRPSPGMFDSFQMEVTTAVGSVQSVRIAQEAEDLRNG